ncbi:MAG: hypothetical protein ACTHMT_12505 [Verrucomicrobiota bacterium]
MESILISSVGLLSIKESNEPADRTAGTEVTGVGLGIPLRSTQHWQTEHKAAESPFVQFATDLMPPTKSTERDKNEELWLAGSRASIKANKIPQTLLIQILSVISTASSLLFQSF